MTDTNDKKNAGASGVASSDLLESLTLQQRLIAAANHYEKVRPEFAEGLRHAIELIGKDGWEHIAPSWAKGILEF
jgi:hypothetical protein